MTHCLPLKALLFGPPGNGKTCLAKKMAEEAGYAFINASGSQIFSMWKGETNKNVTALFEVSLSIFSLLLSYELEILKISYFTIHSRSIIGISIEFHFEAIKDQKCQ